ncbi:peptidoglycan editing factor PgeF [Carboxylicivirga caseinilyticus]|uniref:peptidoglycan editing factor PgeF n=1 Tax=Carboxylicivirga caseinilyticus TaxID=3417572 RepID=UPI003D345AD2|nr:peptidoglycan editing factor PgeF [Marinilabiliaceae bacterium A049]
MFAYCNFCEKAHNPWKIDKDKVTYFVTDKWDGSSRPPYSELNISMNVGDCVDDVLYNRLLVARHSGIPMNRFVFASQVHGDHIEIIDEDRLNKNSYSVIKASDGLITAQKELALVVMAADCVPVLLYDEEKEVIGAFHAGWRGLTQNIITKGVQMMNDHFDCNSNNIKAFIGPSIGQCCYEIKNKVIEAVKTSVPHYEQALKNTDNKVFLDLKKAVELQLIDANVERQKIIRSKYCTQCYSDTFYSYRAHSETGRFCASIALKG